MSKVKGYEYGMNELGSLVTYLKAYNPKVKIWVMEDEPMVIYMDTNPEELVLPRFWYYYDGRLSNVGQPGAKLMLVVQVKRLEDPP